MGLLSLKKKNKTNKKNKYKKNDNPKLIAEQINSKSENSKALMQKYCSSDEVMLQLIRLDPNYIFKYKGSTTNVFKKAMEKLGPDYDNEFLKNKYVREDTSLMEILIKYDPYNIIYYTGMNYEDLVKKTPFSSDIPWFYLEYYNFDSVYFIDHFSEIKFFLSRCNINIDTFFQYQLGSSKDWLNEMMKVIDNDNLDEFLKVKDYFFSNFYDKTTSPVFTINNLIDILINYNNYPSFCNDVCSRKKLNYKEIVGIKFLFSRNEVEYLSKMVKSLDDLDKAKEFIKTLYYNQLELFKETFPSLDKISQRTKNRITGLVESILFNNVSIHQLLGIYGNTENLKILQFNNRNNPKLSRLIGEMTIYTSIMESISNCDDINKIMDLGYRALDNFDLAVECSVYFQSYEEKLRKIFELDCRDNLTRLDKIKDYDSYLDKEKTRKYGVDVLDLSDKAYLLLAHIKSFSESYEEIINGSSNGLKNFISFGVVSYLNQVFFNNLAVGDDQMAFGYCVMLDDSFVLSGPKNLNTNSHIHFNSSEVSRIFRNQRGILETSSALETYENPEILAFREGLKSSCLIVPKGLKITDEAAEVCRKYHLSIVITQELGKSIDNPKKIEFLDEYDLEDGLYHNNDRLIEINDRINNVIKEEDNKIRKIAVLTDIHGLYEVALAILLDCKKQGITEIYSLGDNIGTGPNPDEVLDLLDEFNVKSVKGNHEIYVSEGLDSLEEHLREQYAYEETLKNSDWTRKHISTGHLKDIKLYPDMVEILLGGKKIALIHSSRDYNTGEMIIDPEKYGQILQGHSHFEGEEGNIYTLRGAGIGEADTKKAFYLILTEKEDGGFNIEQRRINYNKTNLLGGIASGDLDENDRKKISYWVGK